MGIALPQLAPASEDRVSGAQIIDGGLRFDESKGQYLKFTPIASGNRRTQTLSVWIKNTYTGSNNKIILGGGDNASGPRHNIAYTPTKRFGVTQNPTGSSNDNVYSVGQFRDYSGWQHLVMSLDCTVGSNSGQVRIYVNGKLQDNGGYSGGNAGYISDQDGIFNTINKRMYLGHYAANPSDPAEFDGYMSQFYWIDGLALGPKYFGYTDPLTNTWRPRKFRAEGTTLNDGTDWSGSTTNLTNGPNGFNGNLGNYAEVSSSGAKGTVTFPKSIEVENSVTFWYSSGQAGNLFINDETTAMEVTGSLHQQDIEFTGTLSSVSIQSGSQPAIWGIAVDGTILESSVTQNLSFGTNGCYLPFDGNTPIGQDQAPSVNDGTVWSAESSLTTTTAGTSESGSLAAVFNGTINANAANAYGYLNGAFDFTWTPNTPISYSNKVRVWTGYGGGTVSLNGGSNVSSVGNNWTTLADGSSGTITSINFAVGSGGGWWSALEVDGVMLVDSQIGNSWTPVNFGGSTDITKATGAKPILNTANGGTIARSGVFGSDVGNHYTILNTSGGGLYRFDGITETNPPLSFVRGATYIFDYSAATSHPLAFSTTDPDSSTTSYTDGVNTATSNVTKITVPHDAPNTLYYYCTSHSNMNNAITVTTDETKADPYAWKNVIALPLVGANYDVSNQINVGSTTKVMTNAGNAAASSTQSNFYNGSFYFDGNGDYLSAGSTSDFALGTNDWTVEYYAYPTSTAQYQRHFYLIGSNASQIEGIYANSSGIAFGRTNVFGTTAVNNPLNQWNHYALVHDSTNMRLYINGIQVATSSSNFADENKSLHIGYSNSTHGGYFTGYMQDFRVYKGVAKYTSNFIPASTNPDILPDTPSGVATKTQLKKITDGAVSFDGTATTKLRVDDSTDFSFGTNDFCIEYFYYNNSLDGTYNIIFDNIDTNRSGIQLSMFTSNHYSIEVGDGSNNWIWKTTGDFPAKQHQWVHFALTRDGNTFRAFENGVLLGTQTSSTAVGNPRAAAIGGYASEDSTNYGFNGFISNFRIVNGSSVYTSNFTPPTRTLTNVTNTKLLCCQSNTEPGGAVVAPTISGINDGTQWSSKVTPGSEFRSGYGPGNAFDGNSVSSISGTTACEINKVSFVEFDFGNGIPFTTLQMQCDDNNEGTVKVNGVDITSQLPTGSFTNTTITGVTSPLKKIRLDAVNANASSVYLGSITIDGVMLQDPLTPSGSPSATNFNPLTTDINTVRGQEGAYATLNPLISTVSLSNGNLKQAQTSGSWNVAVSSIPMSTGKWYCEVTLLDGNTFQMGIIKLDDNPNWASNFPLVDFKYGWGMIVDGVAKLRSDYITQVYGRTDIEYNSTAPVAGDTIGMAYDADIQALTFYVNGRSYGDTTPYWSYPPTPGEYVFGNSVVSDTDAVWNFGQKPFKFPPPDGFQPLTSSTARPDAVIARPDQYVGVSLWTGNGTSQTISGLKHKPDLVWSKARSFGADPELYDSVRGTMERLYSSLPNQEGTSSSGVNAFNADGFGVTGGGGVNNNTSTYVGWTWKAGGSSNTFNVDDVGYVNASDVNMSVGALNSAAYNTSQDWSNSSNTSGNVNTSGNYTPANMFNGILGNESVSGAVCFSTYASNASMTWTSPVSLTNLTSLRLYVDKSGSNAGFLRVNGNNYDGWVTSSTFTDGWIVIPETYLETIQFGYTGGTNTATGIAGVEVNGQLLIDSGNSPANIPSIAATGSSVGTKQGFSIVKYAGSSTNGSTLSHGLGQIPDFVICKNLGTSYNWFIWHNEFGNGENAGIYFTDAAKTTGYGTQPFVSLTEHAITLNNNDGVNGNYNYIMYAWHNVPGLQKFGSYESNSSGVFVELGFRPALLVVKNIDATLTNSQWNVVDTQRDTYNPSLNNLAWNRSNGEPAVSASTYGIDIHSNGFHIPSGNTGEAINNTTATQTYIYAAWAEAPAFNMYGAQSNAR